MITAAWPRSPNIRSAITAAMGERQMLPVQTKATRKVFGIEITLL